MKGREGMGHGRKGKGGDGSAPPHKNFPLHHWFGERSPKLSESGEVRSEQFYNSVREREREISSKSLE